MISAIVLAAGESQRMGSPKALLKIEVTTFIHRIIKALYSARIDSIAVVVGAHASEIRKEVEDLGVTIVINENYKSGQLSSLIAGLEFLERSSPDAALIWPVDHPAVSAETVLALTRCFEITGLGIIVPRCGDRRGHPILLSRRLFAEVKKAPADVGLRAVVRSNEEDLAEIVTEDTGCLQNIDTPEEYAELQRSLSNPA